MSEDAAPPSGLILMDAYGRCARGETFAFVALGVEGDIPFPLGHYSRNSGPVPNSLADHLSGRIPDALLPFQTDYFLANAGWVRARLPVVFDFAPLCAPSSQPKRSLVDFVFGAISLRELPADCTSLDELPMHVFRCANNQDLQAGIAFADPRPELGLQLAIAADFWNLLLAEPAQMLDYIDHCIAMDIDAFSQRVSWVRGTFSNDGICACPMPAD